MEWPAVKRVFAFDVPPELLQILPEGCRNVGRASCVFYPLFAGIQFDTLTGRNDGKGYNFTIVLTMYDSESQNEEVTGRTELEKMALEMKLESIRKYVYLETKSNYPRLHFMIKKN